MQTLLRGEKKENCTAKEVKIENAHPEIYYIYSRPRLKCVIFDKNHERYQ